MSLLNILSSKIADTVLSSNRTLPKMTSTTFAQAGTSLSTIISDVHSSADSSLSSAMGSSSIYRPIIAMKTYAISVDPSNASSYETLAASSISNADNYANTSLSGSSNSLFDIQTAGKNSIASGTSNFIAGSLNINSSISPDLKNLGTSSLIDTGRVFDSASSSTYGSTTTKLNDSINNVNNTVVANSISQNAAVDAAAAANPVANLPTGDGETVLPTVTVTGSGAASTITSAISEGDILQKNTNDIVYQEIKVYIEGVQVPFESASVSQAIGQLPYAMIQIPPQAGLMDISRYYQPKVHIFYTDENYGGDRLLFWGHIISANYSRSQQQSYASIRFECMHKNALLQQITFEWSGGGAANITNGVSSTNTNPDQATVQINNFNSEASLIRSLQGITGPQLDATDLIDPSNTDVIHADPTKLAERFAELEKRMVGMPSVMMNLWNQLKLEVYANEKLNLIFTKMFVPLLEDGVRFFDRMSGHYFVENQVDQTRVSHCNDTARPELSKYQTLLPPAFRLDIQSAVQTKMAINSLKNMLGFSGEMMSLYDLFLSFYFGIEYELITLASPAEIPADPTTAFNPDVKDTFDGLDKMAIETIVKPQVPFYYSPICNVVFPTMYNEISVSQSDSDIPTRITAIDTGPAQATNNPNLLGLNYRAPQSIREAIALGRQVLQNGVPGTANTAVTLKDTTGSSFNLPGKYELGRGIIHRKIAMPQWLSLLVSDYNKTRSSNSDQEFPQMNTPEYKNLLNLHLAWVDRYGYTDITDENGEVVGRTRDGSLDALDPYSSKSNIMAYERLLFSTADYEYTKDVVKSKFGNISGLFNPYIVVGYPMDILDNSPNHPSFHAMCSSVTHNFTSRSIGTSVSFMAAITYTEMSNYYIQPIHPWLQNALKMVNVARSTTTTTGSSTDADASDVAPTPDPVIDDFQANDRLTQTEQAQADATTAADAKNSTDFGLTADPAYDSNTGDVTSVQQGLIGNPRAKTVADQFYKTIFGVCAADPSLIYDFNNGGTKPVARMNGGWVAGSVTTDPTKYAGQGIGGENNDNLTGLGGLRLVSRPIEGRKSIESKFAIKFIDLLPQNYNQTTITYQNSVLTNPQLLEPGASMFLDYEEITKLVRSAYGVTADPNAGSTNRN